MGRLGGGVICLLGKAVIQLRCATLVAPKESEVSRLMGHGVSLEALKDEMYKCRVLCANCH